jgi:hypothetical protein
MDWVADFGSALFGYVTLALGHEWQAANRTEDYYHYKRMEFFHRLPPDSGLR